MNIPALFKRDLSLALLTISDDGEVSLCHNGEPPEVVRKWIMDLKDDLLAQPGEHVEMPVEHIRIDGVYMRKLFLKKGTILVGKIHKKECMNIVAKGDISVLTETGSMRVQEGFTLVSPAGLQKVGYAHEDTIFINVFRTYAESIDDIEAEIACENYADLACIKQENQEALCL